MHLGNFILTDITDRNIMSSDCDFYQRSNNIINDFRVCDINILDTIHSTFFMHMYGCELWNLSYDPVEKFTIAWRKVNEFGTYHTLPIMYWYTI